MASPAEPADQIEPETDTSNIYIRNSGALCSFIKSITNKLYKLINSTNKGLSSLLKMIGLIGTLIFIIVLISIFYWSTQPDMNIVLQPFDNSGDKNLSGDMIAHLLRFDLQKIKAIIVIRTSFYNSYFLI